MSDELLNDTQDVYLTYGDRIIFSEVDNLVTEAVDKNDPEIVMRYGRALRKDARVRGVALAKLLWAIKDNWNKFTDVDDNVLDVIHGEMGVPPSTSNVYIRTWESIFANPEIADEIKEQLLCKPIGTLKLLPALTEDGTDVDWKEIAMAHDKEEVRQIVKRIRGEATSSKTALFIRLDVRTGQLSAKRGDSPFTSFGLLNLDLAQQDDVVKSAVERLIRDARIMED